jgi:hypothetical protein
MMRHPSRLRVLATLVALLLVVPAILGARQSSEKLLGGWPLDRDGSIRIHNHDGSIRVIAWARDSVAVRGSVSPRASFFGGGSRRGIKLGVEVPSGTSGARSTIVAYVPAGANVYVRGATTDISIEELIGSVDVSSVSGAVAVRGDPRDLVAEAMEGSLEISGSPGILRAKTAGASLRWSGSSADATLGAVSGKVEVLGGPLARTRIETITGEVVVDAALRDYAEVVIESHAGAVTVRQPAAVPAQFEVDAATVSGEGITSSSGYSKSGKREPPRTLLFNGAVPASSAVAGVTVRSFKGAFRLLSPVPPR